MSWRWFIQQNDKTEGPFTTEGVYARLRAGECTKKDLIWASGLEQWCTLEWWQREVGNLNAPTVNTAIDVQFHYALNGETHGPMPRGQLITELTALTSATEVMLWMKGMKEWAPIYEFHNILSDLGLNKRDFPRAEISGKAVIKAGVEPLTAPLLTISEGGFGVALQSGLEPGTQVVVELHSPSFREVIHAKAEVRYLGKSVVGFKFTQLTVENKGAIVQLVRQSRPRFLLKAA